MGSEVPNDADTHAVLLGALTSLMSRWSSLEFQRRITAECGVVLDPVAVRALYVLGVEGGSARPSTIADELHLSRPSTSKLLARMNDIGLIDRVRDAADGRSAVISLSATGRDTYQRLVAAGVDIVGSTTVDWDPADTRRLAELLTRFVGAPGTSNAPADDPTLSAPTD
ncbi:MAG: winged helix-turn-helix transcriptional regulator [Actinobacteria bacterium]|nr:winged helix-turn-helix transcriptional regulator [Actinomycetota bacterium]